MSSNGTRTIIWRGGEDQFCIAKIGLILDLESKCNSGIATVFTRLGTGQWYINDVRETIRLGLIGGGKSPEDAMKSIKANVDEWPLNESVMVAYHVIEAALAGVPDDVVGKDQEETEKEPLASSMKTEGSDDQKSSHSEPLAG